MKRILLPLLCLAILSAGCKDDNPRWDGTYDADGEWEVWTATEQNDCFMLRIGEFNYDAILESDANEEDYQFSASADGAVCWVRDYERTGNQLLLSEETTIFPIDGHPCELTLKRQRVITLDSDDAFSETSNVEVFCEADGVCPENLITCNGVGDEDDPACTAEFASIGLRCDDCWVTCEAAAMIDDPELASSAP